MIALIQRVREASVSVDNKIIAKIDYGMLALIGIEKNDSEPHADKLLHKLLNYRIFSDNDEKMNLSLIDIEGDILVVSQFTLAANTRKGLRPSFSSAAPPGRAKLVYDYLVNQLINRHKQVQCGSYGANMQVSLINDGPVTFSLTVPS